MCVSRLHIEIWTSEMPLSVKLSTGSVQSLASETFNFVCRSFHIYPSYLHLLNRSRSPVVGKECPHIYKMLSKMASGERWSYSTCRVFGVLLGSGHSFLHAGGR